MKKVNKITLAKVSFTTTIEVTEDELNEYISRYSLKELRAMMKVEPIIVLCYKAKLEAALINYGAECGIEFTSEIVK